MSPEPIAIIGTGCRLPGLSSSPSRLWELLSKPKDVASKPPADRFNVDGFYHPNPTNPLTLNVRESYFLDENVRQFDTSFFNIAANEATSLDPQQRMLLETVYESLEAAGLRMEALRGSPTGVFCGAMCVDWEALLALDKAAPEYTTTGVARNNLANRISYFFDWNGPSMTIDTACSSSLVALHQGISALQRGECSLVAAVGVNLILMPNLYIAASNLQMLSPNGRSRMWDHKADGYARGEGVASVILKRLGDAVADGDPIECIIRASGVNQDARTLGLTMPSGKAQESLIRSTYALAGLDVSHPEDRPQYFEAHGTGTQAGDFQEASGIYNTFFSTPSPDDSILHIGSIKTVLGHSEGCAGLAGVLKASLCIQNGKIPPNLHFEKLNPKLEPYSSRLKVPIKLEEWPTLPQGVPRRVSVNSFGFGGTNSHAILESYEPSLHGTAKVLENGLTTAGPVAMPFAFSAASERTLGVLLGRYKCYITENPHVDPLSLSWSLMRKRSALKYRVALCAVTVDELKTKINDELALRKANASSTVISRSDSERKFVLGIFTGQGAQWPEMGADLMSIFPQVRVWFEEMQKSLDKLPDNHRAHISLLDELAAPKAISRAQEAAVAQPLCTAVQIVLVNILSALGISFDAVIGHSSGEIAAAYAAGVLNAHDAIRIAHLRGKVARMAKGSNGEKGGMLAADLSFDGAIAFCEQPQYLGRIRVAAYNSPSSVTLSGDADAIREAEQELKDQGKFARILLVDTAYHSHHMEPCAERYLHTLEGCKIQVGEPNSTHWYSSVYGGKEVNRSPDAAKGLVSEYWRDNMCQPVLFYQALMAAVAESAPGLIIEVGPHPALKGPALQGISEALKMASSTVTPYVDTLRRGSTAASALAETVGSLWTYLGAHKIDYTRYITLRGAHRKLTFVGNLPLYPFDHSQSYWTETRRSKAHLQREPRNELLGNLSEDNAEGEWRWTNVLIPDELGYLDGHNIQSQKVFPGTGYLAMAFEAARKIADGRSIRLVQVNDLVINQAITFSEDSKGVGTLFRVYQVNIEGDSTYAKFNCHAEIGGTLKSCASGHLLVSWGEMEVDLLPSKPSPVSGMSSLDIDEFYSHLRKLGYGYSGLFRGITALERKLNTSKGFLSNVKDDSLLVHPSTMDCALQCLLGAVGAPGDRELSRLQIPTKIRKATINPKFCENNAGISGEFLSFDATITSASPDGLSGDVTLFTPHAQGFVQFEGVQVLPLVKPSASDDRSMFSEITWGNLEPDAEPREAPPVQFWTGKIDDPQHMFFLIIRAILLQLTTDDREKLEGHRKYIVAWFDHVVDLTFSGQNPLCKKEWTTEDPHEVLPILVKEAQPILVEMTNSILGYFAAFLRNEISMIEIYRQNDLLTRFYKVEQELNYMNLRVGDLAAQLAFRYPHMKILEVGAGTGSVTRAAFDRLGQYFHSYTFTDISAGFFEDAEATFAEYRDRMIYKTLDIEKDPIEQGFEGGAYDLVIAANVLHATKHLDTTMNHVRRLLKPGGHLIALETTNQQALTDALLFCAFEGWWLGRRHDNRRWGPKLSAHQWEHLLKKTGFSGVDSIFPQPGKPQFRFWAFSTFVSQAIDERIARTRQPLILPFTASFVSARHDSLKIIGGATETTSKLIPFLQKLVTPFFSTVSHTVSIDSLGGGCSEGSSAATAVICLADMDAPYFRDLNETKLCALKRMLEDARQLLWVTAGSEPQNPYLSMSKGFLGCIGHEYKSSLHQYINIVEPNDINAEVIATALMRMVNSKCTNDYSHASAVDSVELELRFENNKMMIPRLMEATALNQRYAATKRVVHELVDLSHSSVNLCWIGGQPELVQGSSQNNHYGSSGNALGEAIIGRSTPFHPNQQQQNTHTTTIRVQYSTSTGLKIGKTGFLALVLGTDEATRTRVVAFADMIASRVLVPSAWCSELPREIETEKDEAEFLRAFACAVLAKSLVQQAAPNTNLLVHGASEALKQSIWCQAVAKGVQPHFSTSDISKPSQISSSQMLLLRERTTTQALSRALPCNLSVLADFSSRSKSMCNGISAQLNTLLHSSVARESKETLSERSPFLWPGFRFNTVTKVFNAARVVATQVMLMLRAAHCVGSISLNVSLSGGSVTCIDEFVARGDGDESKRRPDTDGVQILDWAQATAVPVRVLPASSQVALRGNRTYLLVGMAGDLGQSVCHWMITRGARNIVLASRTPRVEKQWLDDMAALGARVRVEPMDVTNRESILRVDNTIRKRMPPVGGVVNGAMVLLDQMFRDVSLENILETYRPKMDGSRLLEEIYGQEADQDLDFFICFGSASSILGNVGQSSYGAATNYMSSLIQHRRERGLVGSIIHPAEVRGVGYISRMGSELSRRITDLVGTHIVSEKDLHETFAEAILAGNPALHRNPEVVSGITQHDPEIDPDIIWYTDPKTWPLVNYRLRSHTAQGSETGAGQVPVQKQLEATEGLNEAADIVLCALIAKIIQKLHLSENISVTADSRLTELGADSLVAVDLRTWFLKELQVEVPVLQIQSGASIGELASSVTEKLPGSLIPNVKASSG
ncbi:polyketide synthase [Aspergillus stella-maris]|uniref:polyketide synthase n=1 Tax=Aspergillus stella-maris TaxID=1810926 RepID=UPI003CCD7E0C